MAREIRVLADLPLAALDDERGCAVVEPVALQVGDRTIRGEDLSAQSFTLVKGYLRGRLPRDAESSQSQGDGLDFFHMGSMVGDPTRG